MKKQHSEYSEMRARNWARVLVSAAFLFLTMSQGMIVLMFHLAWQSGLYPFGAWRDYARGGQWDDGIFKRLLFIAGVGVLWGALLALVSLLRAPSKSALGVVGLAVLCAFSLLLIQLVFLSG